MKSLTLLLALAGCGSDHSYQVLVIAPDCPPSMEENIRLRAFQCANKEASADGLNRCFNKTIEAYCYRTAWTIE